MLGIMVALIKIAELAKVEAGIGMYAVGVLMLLFPAILSSVDTEELWARVAWHEPDPASDPATRENPELAEADLDDRPTFDHPETTSRRTRS